MRLVLCWRNRRKVPRFPFTKQRLRPSLASFPGRFKYTETMKFLVKNALSWEHGASSLDATNLSTGLADIKLTVAVFVFFPHCCQDFLFCSVHSPWKILFNWFPGTVAHLGFLWLLPAVDVNATLDLLNCISKQKVFFHFFCPRLFFVENSGLLYSHAVFFLHSVKNNDLWF